MFDLDAGKLLIVGTVALIFIPPKDLPRVLRQVGQFVGKTRRMAADFQHQFMDAMREADMADLRREAQKLAESARIDIGTSGLRDEDRQLASALESRPSSEAALDAPVMTRHPDPISPAPVGPGPEEPLAGAGQIAMPPLPSHPEAVPAEPAVALPSRSA